MKRDQVTYGAYGCDYERGVRTSLRFFNRRLDWNFAIFSFSFFFFHAKKESRCDFSTFDESNTMELQNLTQRDNPTQFGKCHELSIVLLDSDRFRPYNICIE